MKKNYIYLTVLILLTIVLTLFLSFLYKEEVIETSYSYKILNKITGEEFNEYMIEHPDTIIYISDRTNLNNNKFEKKFIKELEKLNVLENVIYIDKKEINNSLEKKLEEEYSYKYDEEKMPAIIVVNDGKVVQTSFVTESSSIDSIIDYEVFE